MSFWSNEVLKAMPAFSDNDLYKHLALELKLDTLEKRVAKLEQAEFARQEEKEVDKLIDDICSYLPENATMDKFSVKTEIKHFLNSRPKGANR